MPFVKGQSGNPAGRPRGCRNKVNRRAEVELTELAAAFMGDLIVHARQGNPTAMRLVAERVMPVSRQRPVEVPLPALVSPADQAPAVAQISQALGEGDITIGEAAGLLGYVRQALALAPAPPPSPQSADLAGEIAQLRDVVAQLAARLAAEPGTVRARETGPATDEINGDFFPDAAETARRDGGRPNNQENPDVTVAAPAATAGADADARSMQINAESMLESIPGSMQSDAGSLRINGGQAAKNAAPAGAPAGPTPAPTADAAPAGEREPVTIRENTGFEDDALRAVVLARPFAGPGIPMTISPDVLALMQEPPIDRPMPSGEMATPPGTAERTQRRSL